MPGREAGVGYQDVIGGLLLGHHIQNGIGTLVRQLLTGEARVEERFNEAPLHAHGETSHGRGGQNLGAVDHGRKCGGVCGTVLLRSIQVSI